MKTFVIADMGSNHGGDLVLALRLVAVAAEARVDAVKAQALYPFDPNWLDPLVEACDLHGLELMVTPFDLKAVEILDPYMLRWKIASAELTRDDLLEAVLATHKPVTLSTGMATTDEIRHAFKLCQSKGITPTLLHCVSAYPTPYEAVNLRSMHHLAWGKYPFGISDHTLGIHITLAAVAMGARTVEKHFTLDRDQEGPDHHYALEPDELATMVTQIRDIEAAMGKPNPEPQDCEALEVKGRRLSWL